MLHMANWSILSSWRQTFPLWAPWFPTGNRAITLNPRPCNIWVRVSASGRTYCQPACHAQNRKGQETAWQSPFFQQSDRGNPTEKSLTLSPKLLELPFQRANPSPVCEISYVRTYTASALHVQAFQRSLVTWTNIAFRKRRRALQ